VPLGRLIYNKDGRYLDVWAPTIFELDMAKRALLDGLHAREPDWRVLPQEYSVDWHQGGTPAPTAYQPAIPTSAVPAASGPAKGLWWLGAFLLAVVVFSLGFGLARLWRLGC
jgi:hypothetical protein